MRGCFRPDSAYPLLGISDQDGERFGGFCCTRNAISPPDKRLARTALAVVMCIMKVHDAVAYQTQIVPCAVHGA